ncbi:MAG: PAS domain S-box protein [Anaerolineae bacterium]|nr:PAS domain S-box protein [Anaerolineae bacterium]
MTNSTPPRDSNGNSPFYQMLSQDGALGRLVRDFDWTQTPLGPIDQWPQSLQTAVSICMFSRFPILIWWGPEMIKIYNDAYRPILGTKHPHALGQPGREVWGEIWHIIGPMLEGVLREGTATWSYDQLLLMYRNGYTEETYFTFSYSPILDETGKVGGIFTAVTETTGRVIGERRLKTLHDLGERATEGKTAAEACRVAAAVLHANQLDVPFALVYLLDDSGSHARLVSHSGVTVPSAFAPAAIDLTASRPPWPLAQTPATDQPLMVENLPALFDAVPSGPWADAPTQACVLPIAASGHTRVLGFLIVGVSPYLRLDDDYCHFFALIVNHIEAAIANARAYDEERRRAEALAEIDHARTEFFSNVSHELRTPLTLMLNPLQEIAAHADALPQAQRENLAVAYRNSLRLLKLVNTLLDFARIQANRIHAAFEPTDLALYTTDLASSFRTVIERAGLYLHIDCPPLPEPVYVDRDMWEKIILNLLSNAFKFTFAGGITVALRDGGHAAILRVQDTGIGIAEADQPYIFDRFYRIRGSRARTHEGSGIGLALVAELVRFQGGSIDVNSTPNEGTLFTVLLPYGTAHLPPEQVGAARILSTLPTGSASYTQEALRWLAETELDNVRTLGMDSATPATPATSGTSGGATVLVIDDNADMRDYLKRLLEPRFTVITAPDGVIGLERIYSSRPDLVLADVMMPRLDGFALLQTVRTDLRLRTLPIILLSARAGEESRVEGLRAGADDYMVKPFSARELLARVDAQLQLARLRLETRTTVENMIDSIADPFYAVDHDWRFTYVNQRALEMWRKTRDDLIGQQIWVAFPQITQTSAYSEMRRAVEERHAIAFETYSAFLGRWVEINLYPSVTGLAVYFRDIDGRKRIEQALLNSEHRLRAMFDQAAVGIVLVSLDDIRILEANPGYCAILGYTQEEIVGLTIKDLTHPDDYTTDIDLANQLIRGKIPYYTLEKRYWHKDGSVIWVRLTSSLVQMSSDQPSYLLGIVEDISQRKRAEAAAQIAQTKLDAEQQRIIDIFESISDAFTALDRDYRYTFLNSQGIELTQRMSGKAPDDLIGKSVWDVFPGSYDSVFGETYRHVMTEGVARQFTASIPPLNAWFDVRVYPAKDGLSIYFADVTEQQNTRNALRDAEERLRTMIDSAKDYAIFALDAEGRVMTWNAGAERVFGYQEADILSVDRSILFTPEDRAAGIPGDELQRAIDTGYAESERWHLRKDGSRFYSSGTIRTIRDDAGTLKGFTKIARDATERKLAEDRTEILQQIAAELSAQLTREDMAASIIAAIPKVVGESYASIFLLNAEAGWLESLSMRGLSAEDQARFLHLEISERTLATDTAREDHMIWIGSQSAYLERYPHLQESIVHYDVHGAWSVPLKLDEQVLGVISILFHYPKTLTRQEQDLLTAIAHLCAQALQRAQLFQAEQTARQEAALRAERLSRLQTVTAKLSQALTIDEVARAVVDETVHLMGASTGGLNLLDDDDNFLVIYNGIPKLTTAEQRQWARFPADPALMATQVVRRGEPLWFASGADVVAAFPILAQFAELYPGAWAMMPLIVDKRPIGTMGFTFPERRDFPQEDRDFLMALAYQCSQAIERARLYEIEARARQVAEEADAVKMRFLGMVSHELRTPLASIKGFAGTLLATDITFSPEQQHQFLNVIDTETDRLTSLVDQLLDLSRLQSGTLRIEPTPISINAIFDGVLIQFHTLTADHYLRIDIPDGVPPLRADAQRIGQVLVNLVGNAVKFSPPATPITITVVPQANAVQVDVHDEGVGIPPEEREKVFEAFRQIERKGASYRPGAGLGLAICKSIIEAHGGRIWVQDPAAGTTISFRLPIVSPGVDRG